MKKTINQYYSSTAWAKIKTDLFFLRGKRCEVCGSYKQIQVHHLTYENFGGNEEPNDLVILCSDCHQKEHGLKRLDARDRRRIGLKKSRKNRKKVKSLILLTDTTKEKKTIIRRNGKEL